MALVNACLKWQKLFTTLPRQSNLAVLTSSRVTSSIPCHVIESQSKLHTSAVVQEKFRAWPWSLDEWDDKAKYKEWLSHNDVVYPPSTPDQPLRPAEVTHLRHTVKYSRKKLWYVCLMLRGMSVDESLKQLTFYNSRGAVIMKEIIEEAIDRAVDEHNVEYRSNLWICDAYVQDGHQFTGYRRSRGGNLKTIRYRHCDVYLRLREGRPPKHMYTPIHNGHEAVREYLDKLRKRRILFDL